MTATAPEKPPVDETLSRAEALFAQREDISNLRQAVMLVGSVRDPENRDFAVEWKFAKYNCFLGRQATDEKEREKAFQAGKEAARIASRLQPDRPDGYFWFAANLGESAKLSPITVGLRSIDDIRDAAQKVISIEPAYQGASAYDILAQLELETRLTGGRPENAVQYLEKGIQIEKRNSELRLHFARALLALNKDREAKEQLEYVLQMKPDPLYVPEHKQAVEQARKLLATKF